MVIVLASGLLAGCAEGTRRDAQQGRDQDAERTSVVSGMQATETWNLVHGTPPGTPTSPPDNEGN